VATDINTDDVRQALAGRSFGDKLKFVGHLFRSTRQKVFEARKRRPRLVVSLSPLRGPAIQNNLTQGSQSLALGLTLTAAPQLVEGSRLTSVGCARAGTTVALTLFSALLFSTCQVASTAPPLSAGTLLREYQQSSADARRKYDGKEISVQGLALSAATLPLDAAAQGSVWLQESNPETNGRVGCWFSSQQAPDFSKIVSGQRVTIRGVFNGEAGVELKFCRLVKVE